jgi:type VI secretion system protein ImpK
MTPGRTQNLALTFQEILTAIVRLRSNRQAISDAESFRRHMREGLRTAAQEASVNGRYTAEDIKFATFATVAFLDESILNSRNPLFADWPRKPLQEELFGTHMAGEVFFQNLQQLLGRADSPDLADLLEVYQLCILLGFGGRYSVGGRAELKAIADATAQKIRRIRGPNSGLAPRWMLPAETARSAGGDPWVRKLVYGAVGLVLFVIILFIGFKLSLASGISQVQTVATQGRS